jgi:hypothetical protein
MGQVQDEQSRVSRPDKLAERISSRPALTAPPAVPQATDVTAPASGTPHVEVVSVAGATGQVRVEVQGAVVCWKSGSSHKASPVGLLKSKLSNGYVVASPFGAVLNGLRASMAYGLT